MRALDGALLIVALMIAWSLYRAHRNMAEFNFFDLIMENGKVSRLACIALGSFTVTSWIMIKLALDGKMTEGYLGLYGGLCFTPIVAKLFSNQPASSSTVSVSSSTTTVEAK